MPKTVLYHVLSIYQTLCLINKHLILATTLWGESYWPHFTEKPEANWLCDLGQDISSHFWASDTHLLNANNNNNNNNNTNNYLAGLLGE